jgi:hypothetical protein
MDVQGPVIVTYVYQLVEGEVSRTQDVSFPVHPIRTLAYLNANPGQARPYLDRYQPVPTRPAYLGLLQ